MPFLCLIEGTPESDVLLWAVYPGWTYFKSGVLEQLVTNDDVPSWFPFKLNTESLSAILPALNELCKGALARRCLQACEDRSDNPSSWGGGAGCDMNLDFLVSQPITSKINSAGDHQGTTPYSFFHPNQRHARWLGDRQYGPHPLTFLSQVWRSKWWVIWWQTLLRPMAPGSVSLTLSSSPLLNSRFPAGLHLESVTMRNSRPFQTSSSISTDRTQCMGCSMSCPSPQTSRYPNT